MRKVSLGMVLALGLSALALNLATPRHADASIHEIIAALCRAGGEEVVPPGQVRGGNSFVRALQATGLITSVEFTATQVTINFDPTISASKFKSLGFDLTIPDGFAPGVDLVLSPLIVPDLEFAAHANCHNLNP